MTAPCSCDEALALRQTIASLESGKAIAEQVAKINYTCLRMVESGLVVYLSSCPDGWRTDCSLGFGSFYGSTPLDALAQLTQAWLAENEE